MSPKEPANTRATKLRKAIAVAAKPVASKARKSASTVSSSKPRRKTVKQVDSNDTVSEASLRNRRLMIAEAAYYRAERRGFQPGLEEMDWFEAEKEINATLIIG